MSRNTKGAEAWPTSTPTKRESEFHPEYTTIPPPERAIHAEQALLCAALQGDPDATVEVIRLPLDAWNDRPRRDLAEAFRGLVAEGKTAKPDELIAQGIPPTFIADLSGFGATSNPRGRASEIEAAWRRRDRIERARRLATMAPHMEPAEFDNAVRDLMGETLSPATPPSALPAFADLSRWLEAPPPPRQWTFTSRLPRGIVAGVAARGGAGKSWLLLELAVSAAIGRELLTGFAPVAPTPVLALFGEDPEEEVWQRLRRVARVFNLDAEEQDRLTRNAHLICGWRAALMRNPADPTPTPAFESLLLKVQAVKPGLIIIDPKAQFFGLEENSNDQTVQWYANLSRLMTACDPPPSILVCQHVSKARQDDSDDGASRGASANRDDARAFFSLTPLTPTEQSRYGITNPNLFVKLEQTKANYSERLPEPLILQRQTDSPDTPEELTRGGVLVPIDAQAREAEITGAVKDAVAGFIAETIGLNPDALTVMNLTREKAGKPFRDAILLRFPKITRQGISEGLDHAIAHDLIAIEFIPVKGGMKHVPRITADRRQTAVIDRADGGVNG